MEARGDSPSGRFFAPGSPPLFRHATLVVILALSAPLPAGAAPPASEREAHLAAYEAMLTQAGEALREIRGALRTLSRIEDAAKSDGQPSPVSTELVTVGVLIEVSEMAQNALQAAVAGARMEVATHELRKITVAREKAEEILAAVDAKQKAAKVAKGDSKLEVKTDTDLVGSPFDTEAVVTDIFDLGYDPPDVSPF